MLTAAQLDILKRHSDAGDRIGYYTSLASFGVAYGQLALGVVMNDSVSGAAANSYFLSIASQEGVSVSDDQLAQISLDLMKADFEKRSASSGADLSVDDTQDYHRTVFGDVAGVSANAWTPNYYLESFPTLAERQAAWDQLLTSSAAATFATEPRWPQSDAYT